jgi:hypothetical protein
MEVILETKKLNRNTKSFLNVKNFLTAVKRQSSETTFLPVSEVMYDKEDTSKELRSVYKIDTMYSYAFLAEQGILEWNGIKGKKATVRWSTTEGLNELTEKIKTINYKRKNSRIKSSKSEELVENPIKELENRTDKKNDVKKSFFDLVNKGFEKNQKQNDEIIKNQLKIIELLEKPIEEQSKIVLKGLTEYMEKNDK